MTLSARRGLVLTSSHFNLLGSNTYRWPKELSSLPNQAWDWRREPQLMAHMWKASIDVQKDFEVLWSVGLRGTSRDAKQANAKLLAFTFRPRLTAWANTCHLAIRRRHRFRLFRLRNRPAALR